MKYGVMEKRSYDIMEDKKKKIMKELEFYEEKQLFWLKNCWIAILGCISLLVVSFLFGSFIFSLTFYVAVFLIVFATISFYVANKYEKKYNNIVKKGVVKSFLIISKKE